MGIAGDGLQKSTVSVHAAYSLLSAHCPSALTGSIPSADGHHAECYRISCFHTKRNSIRLKYIKACAYRFYYDFLQPGFTNSLMLGKVLPMCLSGQDRVSGKQSHHVYTKTTPSENKKPTFQRCCIGAHPQRLRLGTTCFMSIPSVMSDAEEDAPASCISL